MIWSLACDACDDMFKAWAFAWGNLGSFDPRVQKKKSRSVQSSPWRTQCDVNRSIYDLTIISIYYAHDGLETVQPSGCADIQLWLFQQRSTRSEQASMIFSGHNQPMYCHICKFNIKVMITPIRDQFRLIYCFITLYAGTNYFGWGYLSLTSSYTSYTSRPDD